MATAILAAVATGLALAAAAVAPARYRASIALAALSSALALAASLAVGSASACVTMAIAAASFSLLGALAAVRRMVFLAAATPHTSVFSVALAVALAGFSASSYVAMFLASLALALGALALSRKLGTDVSTGVVVSLAATGTTLSLYYLATRGVSISSLIVGEAPSQLSVSIPIAVASAAIAIYTPLFLHSHLLTSMDEDVAKLAGVRVWLHDLALAAMFAGIGIATVTSVGFVAQHVLVLVPPAIASSVGKGCRAGLATSTAIAIASACSGTLIARYLGIAPAGAVGAILVASYALSELGARVASHGG